MDRPSSSTPASADRTLLAIAIVLGNFASMGCQDGPMYAIKAANPFYSIGEWRKDSAIGVTDHERRMQLATLADTIDQLPPQRQQFWAEHLRKMIRSDDSPEMRRLAVKAAGRLQDSSAVEMINLGLDDESAKVRMQACRALGIRDGEESARLLAATVGTETSDDVKHAALKALENHSGKIAVDALARALKDRNPATRDLAVQSLKSATGKDYGDDPQVWIAALDGKPVPQVETRIADRVRNLF